MIDFKNFSNIKILIMKDNKKILKKEGIVLESLPSLLFRVKLDKEKEIIAHLSGKLRLNRIKILPGDKVIVEISPYDEKRGRIVYRKK